MYKITSPFGVRESVRNYQPHNGIDFKMELNEPIRSIKEGIAIIKDFGNVNAGKTVFVRWSDGKTAIYGHLNEFAVKNGQHVQPGDLLGYAGSTGHSTGNHLHFAIKENGRFIDPSSYISDIQHMNDPNYFVHVPEAINIKMNFFEYMSQHMSALDSLGDLKLNLISALTNDVLFVQVLKQILQFLSTHASFLNHIITCIF